MEKSVTVRKLRLLWQSQPAVLMVLDFSQAGERPAQVWALPPQALASPAGTEADDIDELLPQYEELPPVGAEATALWRPDDLEANINELFPSFPIGLI
ncbi:hypothetical protein R3I94_006793 [Phoxinus phoxinus]